MLISEQPFINHEFGPKSLPKRQKVHLFPLTPNFPSEDTFQIERTYIELDDNFLSLASFDKTIEEGFELKRLPNRLVNDGVLDRAITFEMSLKRKFSTRQVYSFIDFLADIGGLYNSFRFLAFILLSVFQYWGSYQFIMYDLFTESKKKKS